MSIVYILILQNKVRHFDILMFVIVIHGNKGGFHVVDLIITELKSQKICYKFKGSHWWKIYFSKKNPLQDLLSSLNAVISTNERH